MVASIAKIIDHGMIAFRIVDRAVIAV